jgi:hypothetical protein
MNQPLKMQGFSGSTVAARPGCERDALTGGT